MFSDFYEKLLAVCEGEGVTVSRWPHAHRITRGVIELSSSNRSIVLYVKESNYTPGFWGLNENQLRRLTEFEGQWYIVLLGATSENAYIASPDDAASRLGPVWRQSDDFKIHESAELIGIPRINHTELIDFLVYEVTHPRSSDALARRSAVSAGQTVAEFLFRLPGKSSRVFRLTTRKPEPQDLVIALFGYIFGGDHTLQRTLTAAAPVLGRFIERLSLEESLVIRVLWTFGGSPADESKILSGVNQLLSDREEPTLSGEALRKLLAKLESNQVITRLLTPPKRWRLAEPVL